VGVENVTVDEILAAIDAGLQTALDVSYGVDLEGTCWRCRAYSRTDLCDACREILLAEIEPSPEIPYVPNVESSVEPPVHGYVWSPGLWQPRLRPPNLIPIDPV
jgi:hypothetical protein